MKKSILLFTLFWVFTTTSYSQFFSDNCSGGTNILPIQDINLCNDSEWILVFEDNFDRDSLDLSTWKNLLWPGAPGGLDQSLLTLRNAEVEDGILNLLAKREHVKELAITYLDSNEILSDGLPNYRWFDYTSALILSTKKYSYGYFEASCKIAPGKGIGSAMWMYGDYLDQYNITKEQEIDVFEISENKQNVMNMNIHHDGDACSERHRGPDFSKNFHTFGLLWEPYKIEWFVDGELIRRYPRYFQNGADVGCRLNAWQPYQETPFPKDSVALLFNSSVDNRANNKPDASTPFPSKFQIDWVRYYVHKDQFIPGKSSMIFTKVYPNPANGRFTIETDASNFDGFKLIIIDLKSKIVYSTRLYETISDIDISFLDNGMYFMIIENTISYQINRHKVIISKSF